MSSLDDLFVEDIRLSELHPSKREEILDMLSSAPSKDLEVTELSGNQVLVTYRVSLPEEGPNRLESALRKRAPLSKYVRDRQEESLLQDPKMARSMTSQRSRKVDPSQFIRGKMWVLKFIQEIYTTRFSVFSTEIATPEGKLESFSSYVFSFIQSKFGLASLVKQTTQELLESVKFYSKSDQAVELFGLFLTPYYSVRDLMFFLHCRNVVISELFAKERPQSVLRKTYFEMDIPSDRLKRLTRKSLMYQPKNMKRACLVELRKARHFKAIGTRKGNIQKLRTGVRTGSLRGININTFLKVILEEYRRLAPDYYTLLPIDVPYYHRVRDHSVTRYIVLRSFKKGQRGRRVGQPIRRPEFADADADDVSSGQAKEMSPIFIREDELADHIRRENYSLSFASEDGMEGIHPVAERRRRQGKRDRGFLPTADRDVEELLRTSGSPEEMLLFPSTRRRADEADEKVDELTLPTFNDNLEGVALAEKQRARRRPDNAALERSEIQKLLTEVPRDPPEIAPEKDEVRVGKLLDLTRSVEDEPKAVDLPPREHSRTLQELQEFEKGVQRRLNQTWEAADDLVPFPVTLKDLIGDEKHSSAEDRLAEEREIDELIRRVEEDSDHERPQSSVVDEVEAAVRRLDGVDPDRTLSSPDSSGEEHQEVFPRAIPSRDIRETKDDDFLLRPRRSVHDDFRISSFRFLEDDDDLLMRKRSPVGRTDVRRSSPQRSRASRVSDVRDSSFVSTASEERRRSGEDTKSLIFRLRRDLDLNSLVFSLAQPDSSSEEDN